MIDGNSKLITQANTDTEVYSVAPGRMFSPRKLTISNENAEAGRLKFWDAAASGDIPPIYQVEIGANETVAFDQETLPSSLAFVTKVLCQATVTPMFVHIEGEPL